MCENDYDGDLVMDEDDDCPTNNNVTTIDFKTLILIPLDPIGISQHDPRWVIKNEVKITLASSCLARKLCSKYAHLKVLKGQFIKTNLKKMSFLLVSNLSYRDMIFNSY